MRIQLGEQALVVSEACLEDLSEKLADQVEQHYKEFPLVVRVAFRTISRHLLGKMKEIPQVAQFAEAPKGTDPTLYLMNVMFSLIEQSLGFATAEAVLNESGEVVEILGHVDFASLASIFVSASKNNHSAGRTLVDSGDNGDGEDVPRDRALVPASA